MTKERFLDSLGMTNHCMVHGWEFYWVFDAIFSGENPQEIQTKGREKQVVKKFGDEWKLVHVHYSNMPVTGEREGF